MFTDDLYNWMNCMMVLVNDQIIELPIAYRAFENITGYSINENSKNKVLQPNSRVTLMIHCDSNSSFYIELLNPIEHDLEYQYCLISGISEINYGMQNDSVLLFPIYMKIGESLIKSDMYWKAQFWKVALSMISAPKLNFESLNDWKKEYVYEQYILFSGTKIKSNKQFKIGTVNNSITELAISY